MSEGSLIAKISGKIYSLIRLYLIGGRPQSQEEGTTKVHRDEGKSDYEKDNQLGRPDKQAQDNEGGLAGGRESVTVGCLSDRN